MAVYRECNYPVVVRQQDYFVTEERILNLKSGPNIIGYKIKTKLGEVWYSKKEFDLLFMLPE